MAIRIQTPNGISRYSYHFANGEIAYYSGERVREWEDGKFARYMVDFSKKKVVRFYYGKEDPVSWSSVEWF